MPTYRKVVNSALQYNQANLSDYIISSSTTGKKFLTECPLNRNIRLTELSALYFLIDNAESFIGCSVLKYKDENGNLLYENYINFNLTANVHNAIPINFADGNPFYVSSNAKSISVLISSNYNLFYNGNFELGTGNLFTSWTLTQTSRTNLLQRSQEFDNAYWTKGSSTIVANSIIAPDGTTTADTWVEANGVGITPEIVKAISLSNSTQYTWSIYAKPNGRDWIVINANDGTASYRTWFNVTTGVVGTNPSGSTARIFLDENGFYRCIVTRTTASSAIGSLFDLQIANADGVNTYTGNGTNGVYIWGAQLEQSSQVTPYIPTTTSATTTSVGAFLQSILGGVNGKRCLMMWNNISSIYLRQALYLISGTNYILKFWAKTDITYNNARMNLVVGGTDIGDTEGAIINEWQEFSIAFSGPSTGSQNFDLNFLNDDNYGFVYLDNVSLRLANESIALSEEITFVLDEECAVEEKQVVWLNKLGGYDSWTFLAGQETQINVKRENDIEYSKETNFVSPNRIYANRNNTSIKSKGLATKTNKSTAEWLKSELINSIDVYFVENDKYIPVNVKDGSIAYNTWTKNYIVKMNFEYAYPINIQTR
jgi:hypothetical protein